MTNSSKLHIPYAGLPSEARGLFFIMALAAVARYVTRPPKQSELNPVLETIWNRNHLQLHDFADPSRMTALLKAEFASFSSAGDVQ
jgi:hypothetical protein